jgi:hypothetical protein
MDGDNGMMEKFKAIESALIDLGSVAKTQMSHMERSKGANTMEKSQAKWVVRKAQYQKAKTCLEKVCGFVVKAKLLAFEEKEVFVLLSKFQTFGFKIL